MTNSKRLRNRIQLAQIQPIEWRDSELVRFMQEVSSYRQLSDEETKELIRQYQAGDEPLQDKIVYGNIRIVLYILKVFSLQPSSVINHIDLVQEGCIGMIEAIKKFDLEKHITFMQYAIYYIYRNMYQCIYKHNWPVSIPENQKRCEKKILNFKWHMEQDNLMSIEDIAKLLNISEKLAGYLVMHGTEVYFHETDEALERLESNEEDVIEIMTREEDKTNALKCLDLLKEKDRRFIYALFDLPCDMNQEEKKELIKKYSPQNLSIRRYRILQKIRQMITKKKYKRKGKVKLCT